MVAFLFFNSFISYVIMIPFLYIYFRIRKKKRILEKKNRLKKQFCESLEAVEVLLKSGNSIEQAFCKVVEELEHLQGKDSYMVNEVKHINKCLELDLSIEAAINDLAVRADIEEIYNFAEVFAISKRADGNIVKVITSVCARIRDKENTNRQIRMSISGVLQEVIIMKVMPLGILLYLKVFSKGYFDVVHESMAGQFIMCIVLCIYILACTLVDYMQKKVLEEIC